MWVIHFIWPLLFTSNFKSSIQIVVVNIALFVWNDLTWFFVQNKVNQYINLIGNRFYIILLILLAVECLVLNLLSKVSLSKDSYRPTVLTGLVIFRRLEVFYHMDTTNVSKIYDVLQVFFRIISNEYNPIVQKEVHTSNTKKVNYPIDLRRVSKVSREFQPRRYTSIDLKPIMKQYFEGDHLKHSGDISISITPFPFCLNGSNNLDDGDLKLGPNYGYISPLESTNTFVLAESSPLKSPVKNIKNRAIAKASTEENSLLSKSTRVGNTFKPIMKKILKNLKAKPFYIKPFCSGFTKKSNHKSPFISSDLEDKLDMFPAGIASYKQNNAKVLAFASIPTPIQEKENSKVINVIRSEKEFKNLLKSLSVVHPCKSIYEVWKYLRLKLMVFILREREKFLLDSLQGLSLYVFWVIWITFLDYSSNSLTLVYLIPVLSYASLATSIIFWLPFSLAKFCCKAFLTISYITIHVISSILNWALPGFLRNLKYP